MSALGAALATRPGTTADSSAGSQRLSLDTAGPFTQPSSTVIAFPQTPNTRPVTSRDSGEPSQTTSGEMASGLTSPAAAAVRITSMSSVIRVSAVGAIALTVTP
jgi:hypothetical protein